MKFGQLEYVRNIFLQKLMPKVWLGDYFQTSFCFFKKALYQVKASDLHLSFNKFL